MRYLGGKTKASKNIARFLEGVRPLGAPFYDVLTGGGSVVAAMTGERVANDLCVPLITLYRAYQHGWRPPETLSKPEWEQLRAVQNPDDPLTAFAGFACSYGGKWFGGYAGGTTYTGEPVPLHLRYKYSDLDARGCRAYNYAAQAGRSLARQMSKCTGVVFENLDYSELVIPDGALVYLDAPYKGTTSYGYAKSEFDHKRYFAWAEQLSERATVVLAEYSAPEGWVEHWSRKPGVQLSNTVDKMFMRS